MKTILILTDFSANALQAAKAACVLNLKLGASFLLYNNYINMAVIPQYIGGPWVADERLELKTESKTALNDMARMLENFSAKLSPEAIKPNIRIQYGDGSLGDNIEQIINDFNIEFIVIGASSDSPVDHFLYGSETKLIIDRSTRPVFIIPKNADFTHFKKVVFATDYNPADINAIAYLARLSKLIGFGIEVIHINADNRAVADTAQQKINFTDELARFKNPQITYNEISGKDIIKTLTKICNESHADMLALVHNHYSPFMRLLKKSTSKKALVRQKLPLIIFPSSAEATPPHRLNTTKHIAAAKS